MAVKPVWLCPPKFIPDAAIAGSAAFEQNELYNELRLEAVEAIVDAVVKWLGDKLGLASGEGVGIGGGEISPLDGALVIFVGGEVMEAVFDGEENAVAHG